MKAIPLILRLVTLTASPALAIFSDGFDHVAVGNAQVTLQGGKLKISNLGSSGCDGFSIANGGGSGGSIWLDVPAAELTDGFAFGGEFLPATAAADTQGVWFIADSFSFGTPEVSLDVSQFPGGTTDEYKITIYQDDVEQVCYVGGPPQDTLRLADLPATYWNVDSFFDIDYSDFKVGGPVRYYRYKLTLAMVTSVSMNRPGQPPVQGNRVEIESLQNQDVPSTLDRMVVMAGMTAGSEITVEQTSLKKNRRPVRAAGDGHVTVLKSADLDGDGIDETNFGAPALRVSNLGSSGCDGVSIDWDPDDNGAAFRLPDQLSPPNGWELTLSSTGDDGSGTTSVLGELTVSSQQAGSSQIDWDYTPLGATTAYVEVLRNGHVVSSHAAQAGPIFVLSPPMPSSCGKESQGQSTICYFMEWPEEVLLDIPGQAPVSGDQVRVLAEGAIPIQLETLTLMGAGLPSVDMYVTGLPNTVSLDGLPPGTPVTGLSAEGAAELEMDEAGRLKISNLGSSGCDGVSIALPDDGVSRDRLDLRLAALGDAATNPNSTFRLEAGGRLQGESAVRLLGTLTMTSDGTEISVTPEYSGVGATSVRCYVYDNGQLVSEFVSPNALPALTVTAYPDGCGKEPAVGPGGQTLCYVMDWYDPQTFIVPGKAPVVGNELRVIAEQADAPLDTLTEWNMYASDHEPFVFYDIILASGPVAAPGTPLAPTELLPNFPNPFNPQTTLAFELGRTGPATLRIYALDGRLVRTLVDGSMDAGRHEVVWNGTDGAGVRVASGTYFAQLRAGGAEESRKVTLVK